MKTFLQDKRLSNSLTACHPLLIFEQDGMTTSAGITREGAGSGRERQSSMVRKELKNMVSLTALNFGGQI